MMEWAMLAGGLLAFAALVVVIVRFSRSQDALWPNCAKQFGLTLKEEKQGSGLIVAHQVSTKTMEGTVDGVPLRVVEFREPNLDAVCRAVRVCERRAICIQDRSRRSARGRLSRDSDGRRRVRSLGGLEKRCARRRTAPAHA